MQQHMIACFLGNISAKYYKNPSMLSRVIAKNVGDVFLRHSVHYLVILKSVKIGPVLQKMLQKRLGAFSGSQCIFTAYSINSLVRVLSRDIQQNRMPHHGVHGPTHSQPRPHNCQTFDSLQSRPLHDGLHNSVRSSSSIVSTSTQVMAQIRRKMWVTALES